MGALYVTMPHIDVSLSDAVSEQSVRIDTTVSLQLKTNPRIFSQFNTNHAPNAN